MCGIFAIHNNKDAAKLTYFGLYALQHRGQESCGILTPETQCKGLGLVSDVFTEDNLSRLHGSTAIGHVRYSTVGSPTPENVVPISFHYKGRTFGITHNGHILNSHELRIELENEGSIFQSTNDSEIILQLFIKNFKKYPHEAARKTMKKLIGSYSTVIMIDNSLVAFRDINGFRPMVYGRLGDSYVITSETCALDLISTTYLGETLPGEIFEIYESNVNSYFTNDKFDQIYQPDCTKSKYCIFELIYFARPDSYIFGDSVYRFRKKQGELLANEYLREDIDLVMPLPDSGNYAAIGYSQKSGISLETGMIRNHYVGRSFIQPSQDMRDFNVKVKLNPVKEIIEGKNILIIDDSIVRGTTAKKCVSELRSKGAKKIYMAVSCPPIKYPCQYGIDFTTKRELIASMKSISEIRDFIGLDGLHYLSMDSLKKCYKNLDNFCFACFDGSYPTGECQFNKHCLEE